MLTEKQHDEQEDLENPSLDSRTDVVTRKVLGASPGWGLDENGFPIPSDLHCMNRISLRTRSELALVTERCSVPLVLAKNFGNYVTTTQVGCLLIIVRFFGDRCPLCELCLFLGNTSSLVKAQ